MQRREFLKLSGAALGSTLLVGGLSQVVLALPAEVQSQGKFYRGYRKNGDIFVSHDAGKTWELHTQLGSDYSIQDLFTDSSGRVNARVGFMHYHFHLFLSKEGDKWKTS